MAKYGEKLYDMACDIVEELEQKKELSMSDLEKAEKATTLKKNLLKIDMMGNDAGYSNGDWRADGSYGRGSYGYSSRRRDSMGRYSKYGRGGGSRESLMAHLDDMMAEAATPEDRDMVERFRREMNR